MIRGQSSEDIRLRLPVRDHGATRRTSAGAHSTGAGCGVRSIRGEAAAESARSHEAEDRRQCDALVNAGFAGAGLPLLHVVVQTTYHPAELKTKIAALLAETKHTVPERG